MYRRTALVFVVIALSLSACANGAGPSAQKSAATAPSPAASQPPRVADAELTARLKEICARARGRCGAAVLHIETGQSIAFEGETPLPLYSVFKLPLAITVLKEVEEGRLRLDQKVRVEPAETVQGAPENMALWRKPSERTLRELLEFSIVRSDNTSSDKMLELVGGPEAVTRRMLALGLKQIEVRSTVKELVKKQGKEPHANTGAPDDLTRLLALLQQGAVLAPPQLEVLFGFMSRVVTGDRRLRAGLPAGTPIADKTGSGPSAANDAGIVTLPGEQGHLAVAVLIDSSKLPVERREDLIAEVARAAYDAYVKAR